MWIRPVTNRKDGNTRTTHEDFNRICGNINIAFGASLKDTWVESDIVDAATWNTLIGIVQAADPSITYYSDYRNLNKIELATLRANTLYPSHTLYPSNTLYPTEE